MTSKNVIVPRMPTDDMLEQMYSAGTFLDSIDLWPAGEVIYKGMCSAAPQQSEEEMIELVARAIYATESPWTFDDMARAALKALGLIA